MLCVSLWKTIAKEDFNIFNHYLQQLQLVVTHAL